MSRTRSALATGAMLLLLTGAAVAIYLLSRGAEGPVTGTLLPPPSGQYAGRGLAATDVAVFGAVVVATEGEPTSGGAAVGSGCLVRAQLVEGPTVGHLTVRCGEQILYRSIDPAGPGRHAPEREIAELPGPLAGTHRYALRYSDAGPRSGPRPQLDVDTRLWRARIFRQGPAPWSLTLHVAELSFPRWGMALGRRAETNRVIGTLRLRARASDRRGEPPLSSADVEALCELYLRGGGAHDGDCRVLLRCGAQLVYDSAPKGSVRCDLEAGLARTAVDAKPSSEDGDPMLRFDRQANTLRVEDDGWAVDWRLDEPPACGVDGHWLGFGIDSKATPWELSLDAGAQGLVFNWSLGTGPQTSQRLPAPESCGGLIELRTADDGGPGLLYQLELGPGWRSFGGRWEAAQAALVAAAR